MSNVAAKQGIASRVGRVLWQWRVLIGICFVLFPVLYNLPIVFSVIDRLAGGHFTKRFQKTELQTLEIPDRDTKFVLMADLDGPNEKYWYVYKMPLSEEPTSRMRLSADSQDSVVRVEFKTSLNLGPPQLEDRHDKFILLQFGETYYWIYDMDREDTLILRPDYIMYWPDDVHNYLWNMKRNESNSGEATVSDEEVIAWIRKYLHEPIVKKMSEYGRYIPEASKDNP